MIYFIYSVGVYAHCLLPCTYGDFVGFKDIFFHSILFIITEIYGQAVLLKESLKYFIV